MFLDKLHGTPRDLVFEVPVERRRPIVFPEIGLAVAANVRVPVDVPGEISPEILEPVTIRPKLRLEAEMPFADQRRRIAGVAKQLRQ